MSEHIPPDDRIVDAVRSFLTLMEPVCGDVAEVTGFDGTEVLALVARSAYVRQYEALASMVNLADSAQGSASAQLLRPACEEMIVLEYLAQIPRAQAERLVKLLAQLEIGDDLKAQRAYTGDDAEMLRIGFSERYLDRVERLAEQARQDLGELAAELDWSDRRPRLNIRMLAERTGRLDVYLYLYHASSRFVHFKVKELMRRAWGNEGVFTISSEHFSRHWRDFSLYWGMYIHTETALAMLKLAPDLGATEASIDEDELHAALEMLGERVPLITPDELLWEGNPNPWDA